MKYIINFFKGIIFTVWLVIAIFTTVCLISYNDYNVTEFGKKSLIIVDDDNWEPKYNTNELLVVTKEKQNKYNVGDEIFFYRNKSVDSYIFYAQIDNIIESNGIENTYQIGGKDVFYSDVIGNTASVKVYPKYIGLVLRIFESRWGYMFLVILPTLFLLVYEIYTIIIEAKREIRREKRLEEKEAQEEAEMPSLKEE